MLTSIECKGTRINARRYSRRCANAAYYTCTHTCAPDKGPVIDPDVEMAPQIRKHCGVVYYNSSIGRDKQYCKFNERIIS